MELQVPLQSNLSYSSLTLTETGNCQITTSLLNMVQNVTGLRSIELLKKNVVIILNGSYLTLNERFNFIKM